MELDSKHKPWPFKMTLKDKLEILGISEDEFDFYCEAFIQTWKPYMIMRGDEDWRVIKNKTRKLPKLDEHVVAYHLLGRFWVAAFAPPVPSYLCIDIDASENLLSVYKIVRNWLPHSIVFQSSSNKGLHVYVFLRFDFPITANKLISIVSMELKIRGVQLAPGVCEVFPAPNRFLRLPLGQGSCLLDPKNLRFMNLNLAESIEFIKEKCWRHGFEELFPGLYRKVGGGNVKF